MKGEGGGKASARTLRAIRSNENSGAPGTHIKREEEASSDVPGPLTTSGKQLIKREAKAESARKPRKRQKVKKEDPVAAQMIKLAPVPPSAYTGPYPKHMRPSPEECRVSAQAPRLTLVRCHISLHVVKPTQILFCPCKSILRQIYPEAALILAKASHCCIHGSE